MTYLLWPTPSVCLALRFEGGVTYARWAVPGWSGPWRVVVPRVTA